MQNPLINILIEVVMGRFLNQLLDQGLPRMISWIQSKLNSAQQRYEDSSSHERCSTVSGTEVSMQDQWSIDYMRSLEDFEVTLGDICENLLSDQTAEGNKRTMWIWYLKLPFLLLRAVFCLAFQHFKITVLRSLKREKTEVKLK